MSSPPQPSISHDEHPAVSDPDPTAQETKSEATKAGGDEPADNVVAAGALVPEVVAEGTARDTSHNDGRVETAKNAGGRPAEQQTPLQGAQEEATASSSDAKGKAKDVASSEDDSLDASEQLAAQMETLNVRDQDAQEEPVDNDRVRSPTPPPPPPKDEKYLSSSNTPTGRRSPAADQLPVEQAPPERKQSPYLSDGEYNEKYEAEGAGGEEDQQAEIQSIMDQFEDGTGGPGMEEIMSPRLEIAQPMFGSPTAQHPPRKSSLEPLATGTGVPSGSDQTFAYSQNQALQSPPPRTSSLYNMSPSGPASLNEKASGPERTDSPRPPSTLSKSLPPKPDPEPDRPFDFHRFLDQLRHKSADPVAKFLRSFLNEFGKKQWMVHEQVKIIGDFLEFITKKMSICEVWRTVSDAEFENAREGMEKLVMTRLYSQTFSPAIPPPEPVPAAKNRRRGAPVPMGPGRRGQHQEDVERDEVLAQRIRIYSWVKEEHLDIKPLNDDRGRKFLGLAQQELIKIKSYRAPRDKVICILNCCKVIFGFLRGGQHDQSADSFVPLLIYTVLKANPDHLVSNVQYILRFRNQDKLVGEAGYYISSLMGAIQFIESLDRTSLTITDQEFEANVEAAVSAIAERHSAEEERRQQILNTNRGPSPHLIPEKSTLSRPEVTPRNSLEAERATPRRSTSLRSRNGTSTNETDGEEENAAVAGLLRTIQRPLSTIGRIFSDSDTSTPPAPGNPVLTPQPGSTPRLSPAPPQRVSGEDPRRSAERERKSHEQQRQRLSAEDAAARQASAEAEEARKIQRQEHRVVVETLSGMFPDLDKEVISDVVRMKEGRVGLAVDACLALST